MNDLPIVSSSGSPPGVDRRPKASQTQSTGLSVGRVIFVLFTLSAFIVLGWFVWSINSVLNERTAELQESAERIAELESQLSANTEVFTESGDSMNEQITFWESETRKLWANYQRHQAWIEDKEPVFTQLGRDIDALDTQMKSMQGSLTDIENTVTQIGRQQRNLTDKLNSTLQQTNALLEQLDLRVERNEEAVEAIDDSRRQTNSAILDIRRRLADLESSN